MRRPRRSLLSRVLLESVSPTDYVHPLRRYFCAKKFKSKYKGERWQFWMAQFWKISRIFQAINFERKVISKMVISNLISTKKILKILWGTCFLHHLQSKTVKYAKKVPHLTFSNLYGFWLWVMLRVRWETFSNIFYGFWP